MRDKKNDFAKYLTCFLSKYLPGQQNVSMNTVAAYRDTFKLFLTFCESTKNLKIENITLAVITRDLIVEYLDWIEIGRKCSISTRNQRLAAIHAFFRYVQKEIPENLFEIQRILAIPIKKKPRPVIPYLTANELEVLFKQPDKSHFSGMRDLVIMVVLYDTGARVQELIDLTYKDVRLDTPAIVTLRGKGRKKRHVPIMGKTYDLLKEYIKISKPSHLATAEQDLPIFRNQQNQKFTRRGISYIINKYVTIARRNTDFKNMGNITPHIFRHTKAMHLLQAGVNLIYIRDFLGHVNISSTEIYARADSELKRKALESAYIDLGFGELPAREKDGDLMNWLQNLCR